MLQNTIQNFCNILFYIIKNISNFINNGELNLVFIFYYLILIYLFIILSLTYII